MPGFWSFGLAKRVWSLGNMEVAADDYLEVHRERVEDFLAEALSALYTAKPDPLDFIGRAALSQASTAPGAAINEAPKPCRRAA